MPTKPEIVITRDYLGGKEGIAAILNDYYEREIGRLDAEEQPVARRFIEEGLIVNGKRVGLAEGLENSQFGVTGDLLQNLLDSRLIRSEAIHLGKIYEVSHDTLVEPILQSFEQRKKREDAILARENLEAERARRKEAERRRNRAKLYAIIGFTLFFIALVAGVIAFQAYRAAEKSRLEAEAARAMAQSEQRKSEEAYRQLQRETEQRETAQFNEIMGRGRSLLLEANYVEAANEFRLALSLRPENSEASAQLLLAQQRSGVKSRYNQLMQEGDALVSRGSNYYVAARQKYRLARQLRYNDSEADSRLTGLEGRLEKYFIELVGFGDTFFKAGNGYQEALEYYRKALEIKTDPGVRARMLSCQEKLKNKQ
ncbi:MAG: hypothetical protein IPL27_03775 [Lewinellaceae bacterium]|nr:hypothetical protein [Lewinellaceae bacterium]